MGRISDLKKTYISIAVILLTTFILFLILNLLILGAFTIRGLFTDPQDIEYRMQVYPNWSKEELQNLYSDLPGCSWSYQPYTQFKMSPYNSKYVNIDPNGFRMVKNQGPWPPSKDAFNIFIFGGSTTFGAGVADSEIIASQIQEKLNSNISGRKIYVYNFGTGHYFSSQERAFFAKLISEGKIPDLAIFIDGLNDFYYAPNRPPALTTKLEKYVGGKTSSAVELVTKLPLYRLAGWIKRKTNINIGTKKKLNFSDESILTETIDTWLRNKKQIEGVSDKFGIKCLFVIQPVPTYKYNLSYHLFVSEDNTGILSNHQYSIKGYELLNERYEELSPQEKDNILWLADLQENREEPLYVDTCHYTANFSGEIANYIVETIKNKNLICNKLIEEQLIPLGGEQ